MLAETVILWISIHSLRMEGDDIMLIIPKRLSIHFNPLPPHGGRLRTVGAMFLRFPISIHSLRMEGDLLCLINHYLIILFQSTPSAWRETHSEKRPCKRRQISIHSLRMEGDNNCRFEGSTFFISIHSLRMEGDMYYNSESVYAVHFNPLPPHGGRPSDVL